MLICHVVNAIMYAVNICLCVGDEIGSVVCQNCTHCSCVTCVYCVRRLDENKKTQKEPRTGNVIEYSIQETMDYSVSQRKSHPIHQS